MMRTLGRWRVGFVSTCAAVAWAIVLPARAATIGNVCSFSTSGQDVTFDICDGSKVRLTILAADLLRVRIAPDGVLGTNPSHAVVADAWPPAAFTTSDGGSSVTVTTDAMQLVVRKQPFVLECRDLDGSLVLTDDPTQRIQWGTDYTRVYKTTRTGESYVGLGWRPRGLVQNGTQFEMRNVPAYASAQHPDAFYGGVPIWYGLRNGNAYAVFFDDTSFGIIDMTNSASGYMSFENLGGTVDYYYFAGPTMAGILDRYTVLTGRPYMPPRWAVGYQQCRWSYTPDSEVISIADGFRSRNIPCDVIYLDIDYMDYGYQLTFDPTAFSDPAGLLDTLHAQGFQVVTNISPWLAQDDPKYAEGEANDCFLQHAGTSYDGWSDYLFFVMRGAAGTGWVSWVDFTNSDARSWYTAKHTPFLNYGVDGIWNDLNEPDPFNNNWPDDVKYSLDGLNLDHDKTGNQYCLYESEFSYDVLKSHYPGRRPFVLSRGAFAGIQRAATVWSGDNSAGWYYDMKRNIPMGLAMSISGQPHNGHDIGGFFGNPYPSSELYTRWMQWGVFSAFCRQHHDGYGNHEPRDYVEPWQFDAQVEAICRDFISLRYRLMPYLYTLFYRAHTTGEPIQRPTLFDFPGDSATLTQDYDFMFGPFLLVSPVTEASAATWNTYLPDGAEWIDWWTDARYDGGQTVNTATPLERMPLFVRRGAIIPMAPLSQYEGQTPVDVLTLRLYPADQATTFTLYEDDGISWEYLAGDYAETTYTMIGEGDSFVLDIGARTGGFVPTARSYRLEVHRWPGHTRTATLNDVEMTEYASWGEFDAAAEGYFLDPATDILYAKFADTGGHLVFSFGGVIIPDVPGDLDHDGDVDQEDAGGIQACLAGPGIEVGTDCRDADLDSDKDVDQTDMNLFKGCMTPPTVFGDPHCAD